MCGTSLIKLISPKNIYMCAYICIYMFIYMHMYIYTYIRTHEYIRRRDQFYQGSATHEKIAVLLVHQVGSPITSPVPARGVWFGPSGPGWVFFWAGVPKFFFVFLFCGGRAGGYQDSLLGTVQISPTIWCSGEQK